jgi:hypothetical protein
MRKALYILLTVLAGLLLSATTVYAAGWRYAPEPPEFVVVKRGEVIQKAHTKAYRWHVWSGRTDRWYEREYTAKETSFPVEDAYKASKPVRVRFMWPVEPTRIKAVSYKSREMKGEGRELPVMWDAYVVDGQTAGYTLFMAMQTPGSPHYVKLYVYWGPDGTHRSYGWTTQLLHFHTYTRGTH